MLLFLSCDNEHEGDNRDMNNFLDLEKQIYLKMFLHNTHLFDETDTDDEEENVANGNDDLENWG